MSRHGELYSYNNKSSALLFTPLTYDFVDVNQLEWTTPTQSGARRGQRWAGAGGSAGLVLYWVLALVCSRTAPSPSERRGFRSFRSKLLVTVVVGLEGSVDREAEVVALLLAQLCQLDVEGSLQIGHPEVGRMSGMMMVMIRILLVKMT